MNLKRKLFCQYYAGECAGNGEKAAILAGYNKHSARSTAYKLLQNAEINAYLTKLSEEIKAENVASIEEIQSFWTGILRDETEPTKNRIRASELLAKCKGMFNNEGW